MLGPLKDLVSLSGGRQRFLAYVSDGMKTRQWPAATLRHFGIADLGTLQTRWVAWVGQGSPQIEPNPQPAPAPAPVRTQLTRPQHTETPRQTILEWRGR